MHPLDLKVVGGVPHLGWDRGLGSFGMGRGIPFISTRPASNIPPPSLSPRALSLTTVTHPCYTYSQPCHPSQQQALASNRHWPATGTDTQKIAQFPQNCH